MSNVAFSSIVFFQQIRSAILAFDLLPHIFFIPTLIHSIPLLIVLCRRRIGVNQSLLPVSSPHHRPLALSQSLSQRHISAHRYVSRCLASLYLLSYDTVWFWYRTKLKGEVCTANGSLNVCKQHADKWAIRISAYMPLGCFQVIVVCFCCNVGSATGIFTYRRVGKSDYYILSTWQAKYCK